MQAYNLLSNDIETFETQPYLAFFPLHLLLFCRISWDFICGHHSFCQSILYWCGGPYIWLEGHPLSQGLHCQPIEGILPIVCFKLLNPHLFKSLNRWKLWSQCLNSRNLALILCYITFNQYSNANCMLIKTTIYILYEYL